MERDARFLPTKPILGQLLYRTIVKATLFESLLRATEKLAINKTLFRRALRKQKSNLLVLAYHSVTRNQFRTHMQFLDRWFEFSNIDELIRMIKSHRFPSDLNIIITFDDGLKNFYQNAFPVVEELGVPVIIYVTSGVVDSEFWLNRQQKLFLVPGKSLAERAIPGMAKTRQEAKKQGFRILPGLTGEELREIARSDYVTIGSHSMTHPILPRLSDEDCRKEIFESMAELCRMVRHDIHHFAYPLGAFSSREVSYVKEAGYSSGAGVGNRWIGNDSTVFGFPRIGSGPEGGSDLWLKYRLSR